jgi:hypothetical protein
MKKQTKMVLAGVIVLAVAYYLYNMKHEAKEKAGTITDKK